MNDVGICFDRDSKKYCPKSLWENPNGPFKVNPPFDFASKKYESQPVFTIEKTKTWGDVEGKADAAGYAQNSKDYSNAGIQVQSA